MLLSCDPPASVRYQEVSPAGMYASVPVCFSSRQIALGDSETEVRSLFATAMDESWNGDIKQVSWKEYDAAAGVDSLITCRFLNGYLVDFRVFEKLEVEALNKEELRNSVAHLHPCIDEVMDVLNFGSNLMYLEETTAVSQFFKVVPFDNGYRGLMYGISYKGVPGLSDTVTFS